MYGKGIRKKEKYNEIKEREENQSKNYISISTNDSIENNK